MTHREWVWSAVVAFSCKSANSDSKSQRVRASSKVRKVTVCWEIGVSASYMFLPVLLLPAVQSGLERNFFQSGTRKHDASTDV